MADEMTTDDKELWAELFRLRDGYVARRIWSDRIFGGFFALIAAFCMVSGIVFAVDTLHPEVIAVMFVVAATMAFFSWICFHEARKKGAMTLLRDYAQNPRSLKSWSIATVKSGVGIGPVAVYPLRMVFVDLFGVEGSHEQFRIPGRLVEDTRRLLSAHEGRD